MAARLATAGLAGMALDDARQIAMTSRWIELEGAHNVRDLGGLPAAHGVTRHGVLLRSDNLDALSETDSDSLFIERGVRLVIDLRSDRERAVTPAWRGRSGLRHVAFPLLEEAAVDAASDPAPTTLGGLYLRMLERQGATFVQMLQLLVESGATPALVHCAAGKDRTGVTSALLLGAAGVEREAIVADYCATNERMGRVLGALRGMGYAVPVDTSDERLMAPDHVMRELLDHIDQRHGGVGGFFLNHGADPKLIDDWRGVLVSSR